MCIGAIDIGTNSVRLLIATRKQNSLQRLISRMEVPRLGIDVEQTGYLKQAAIERTLEVLTEYQKLITDYDAVPYVVATSAVREADNGEEFVTAVQQKTGLQIEVVSGLEEATLSYLGIASGLSSLEDKLLAVDIGGGSTELITGSQQEVVDYKSINLGAVRLQETYGERTAKLKEQVNQKLSLEAGDFSQLVGVGGTITTVAAVDKSLEVYNRKVIHNSILSQTQVEAVLTKLADLSVTEREQVAGLSSNRADIIIPGIIILLSIMKQTGLKELTVSEAGILEGLVYQNT